jgi:glycosyltransferase involved in cell wall biosynthesis/tetratricopeptide (TPR) repeat protein
MTTEPVRDGRCLVAFATRWGPEFGGINVFNSEFLQHLSFALQGRATVACIVPVARPDQTNKARARGVNLFSDIGHGEHFDRGYVKAAVEELSRWGILRSTRDVVWLGHDRITGQLALWARDLAGGRAALIHHMSYSHYEAYAENAASANSKAEAQKALFQQADLLFGVGPVLRDALSDMVPGKQICSLIPGVDEIPARVAPKTFTAFMSGRLSSDTAKIKQSHLGVAAFAHAFKRAIDDPALPDALRHQPRLILRGVSLDYSSEMLGEPDPSDWLRFAEDIADRVVNIHALPFAEDRKALVEELTGATVALMPSWHEGFGLAGWEAIGAGVPLILTKNSGLFQLLKEEEGGAFASWTYPVDVRGQIDAPFFHREDLKEVSDRILEIARDPNTARDRAARLREMALSRYSWKHCVDSAIKVLDWATTERVVSVLQDSESQMSLSSTRETADNDSFPLKIPRPLWKPSSGLAVSQLLRAEEGAVPFDVSRQRDLDLLLNWARNGEFSRALRLVTGSGGTGKTRLALELCNRLVTEGWKCGFLASEMSVSQARDILRVIVKWPQPVLVVLDYAETRQETLLALLRVIIIECDSRLNIRLLLLARAGGEWWERLPARDSICESLLSGYATTGPFALAPMHDSIGSREAAYRAAVEAYGARLEINDITILGVDLDGPHFAYPLYVQMAALLSFHGERPAGGEGLTKAMLNHEIRYWSRSLQNPLYPGNSDGLHDQHAAELMTLATLAGGFSRPVEAQQAWERWVGSSGRDLTPIQKRALFERLSPLYPGSNGIQPLRPDLLGEALVAQALLSSNGSTLLDTLLGAASNRAERRSTLTVLARLSVYRRDLETTVAVSLARNLVASAADILAVAVQHDSCLPEWTEHAFLSLSLQMRNQAVGVLLPHFHYESVQLAKLACAVSSAEVAKLYKKLQNKPKDKELRGRYARALHTHAVDLSRAGADALVPAREAMELLEQLVEILPERYQHPWANALNTYAGALASAGHYADAVVYSRRSMEAFERAATHGGNKEKESWASAILNYSTALGENGEASAALSFSRQAVQIYGRLRERDPSQYEVGWARALSAYARDLANNNDHAEALEYAFQALEVFERLASENKDRHEPDLAMTLMGYASYLSTDGLDLGHAMEAAQRALLISEKLANKNPDLFEVFFTQSLVDYASILTRNRRYPEALTYDLKALAIAEKPSARNADAFERFRPATFRNCAIDYRDMGQYSEALIYSQRAIDLYSALFQRNSDVFAEGYAYALSIHADSLRDAGDYDRSWRTAQAALSLTERLATKQPVKFAENVYSENLSVHWSCWLLHPTADSLTLSAAIPGTCKPHVIAGLGALRLFLLACDASNEDVRSRYFSEMLECFGNVNPTQQITLEPYWLCASGWCATHAPHIVAQQAGERWLAAYHQFYHSRGGHLPQWMMDLPRHLHFLWPDN